MDWKQVGRTVVGMGLPLLGSVLGGSMGERAGGLVAEALGVAPEPKTVADRMSADPEAALKLFQVQQANELELTRIVANETIETLRSINETMRVEAQSDKWWVSGWRPFWGFASAGAFVLAVIGIFALAFYALAVGDATAMAMIPNLVSMLVLLFGIPASFLGIASWHRGKEKIAKATRAPDASQVGAPPVPIGARLFEAAAALAGKLPSRDVSTGMRKP